jgi:hypothetical protein
MLVLPRVLLSQIGPGASGAFVVAVRRHFYREKIDDRRGIGDRKMDRRVTTP